MTISKKISYINIGVVLFAVVVGGAIFIFIGSNMFKNITGSRQLESSLVLMNQIDRILYECKKNIINLSMDDEIGSVLNKTDKENVSKAEIVLNDYLTTSGSWLNLKIIDMNGNVILSTNKKHLDSEQINYSDGFVKKAMGGEVVFSDVVEFSGEKIIFFAAPVINKGVGDNSIIGVVEGDYLLNDATYLIEKTNFPSATLLNKDGKKVVSFHNNPALSVTENNLENSDIFNKTLTLKEDGTITLLSLNSKVEVLATFVREKGYKDFKGNNWILVVETPTQEILNSSLSLILKALLPVSAVWLLSSFILLIVLRNLIVKPILVLTKAVSSIGSGEYDIKVPVVSTDEIGQLAKFFNQMADNIKNSRLNLEEQIKEKTKGISDSLNITKDLYKKLREINSQIESKNRSLEDSKVAMLNILEDQKVMESNLKGERDTTKTILNSVGDGILVVDSNSMVTMINPAAQKLLEVTEKEAVGKPWSNIAVTLKGTSEVPLGERSFSQVIKTRKEKIVYLDDDHYYRTKSGRKFPIVSITAPITRDGAIVGAVKAFRDATAEKESKKLIEAEVVQRTKELTEAKDKITEGWLQLQKEKAKLAASIENMPVGFLMIDSTGGLIVVNSVAQKIMGAKDGNDTLTKVKMLLGDRINIDYYLRDCSESTKTLTFSDLSLPDGRFFRVLTSPIITVEKERKICIGIVLLVEDVTEAKILERSKDEFFSIASHELRTPLTAIKGNTSLIEQFYGDKLTDPELKSMIADIHESSVRLIGIVNDFLDLSRLETGKIGYKKQSVDLGNLIDSVVKELLATSSEKNLELEYIDDPKNKVPEVSVDPDKTKQVLINIIGNSLKYTEKGGITITTQTLPGFVKVLISDTGRGISPENQKLLFRKFQQAGSSILTRDTTKGTGLGLYISKLIIQGMGGEIKLESTEIGKGSVFSFTLPIITNDQEKSGVGESDEKVDSSAETLAK